MSFSWGETITQGVTTVKSSHFTGTNDLRNSIDHLRTHTGLSAYSWAQAVAVGDKIDAADFTEARTAFDGAYDQNYCHAVCSSHNATYYASNYAYYGGHYGYYGGNYAYCTSHYLSNYSNCDCK